MLTAADWTWTDYSLSERDRRWDVVRANAARVGVDCIFLPLCLDGRSFHLSLEQARGARSDCRYLTGMENAAVVLPTDGRSPIVINERGDGNEWIQEARPIAAGAGGGWAPAMVQALLDAGMERARIGVVGLGPGKVTHGRALSGVINHSSYAAVLAALPNATFEDATDVVGFARYVKSEEEIECLRIGATIATAGIETMVRVARPGIPEATVYAEVMRSMLELGSEYYPLAWNVGPIGARSYRHENPQLGRVLDKDWLITNEVDAVVGRLVAQETQPVLLGALPEEYRRVTEVNRDVFEAGLEYMKPGRFIGELVEFVNGYGAKFGVDTRALFHGRGYGDDGPLVTGGDTRETMRDVMLEKNAVFVWKPTAASADGKIMGLAGGGCVLVIDNGGVPLVDRDRWTACAMDI